MTAADQLTTEGILALFEQVHAHDDGASNEGLRERKKRRQRQQISNVATAMFLAEGFDNVSVSRIAAACDVSEQTVFNYFPTKESMFFDRSESMADALAAAVRQGPGPLSTDVARGLAAGAPRYRWASLDDAHGLALLRLFGETAEGSAALRTARYAEFGSLAATVGGALAARIGADPDTVEIRLAAVVISGLAQVWTQAAFTHVPHVATIAALESAVQADVERALRLAAPMLDTLDGLHLDPAAGPNRR
jgi:AcrR family transcriptional regulator